MTDSLMRRDRVLSIRIVIMGVVALAFLAVAATAIVKGEDSYDLSFGKNGISIKVKKSDDLGTILDKAVGSTDPSTRRTARSLMRERGFVEVSQMPTDSLSQSMARDVGFYHIEDPQLARQIAQARFDGETHEIRTEFLNMLWSRNGPFEADILSDAPVEFLSAFSELRAALKEDGKAPPLLAAMWENSIEWKTPFELMKFRADIEVLPDADPNRIYICKGAEHLEGKYVRLSIPDRVDPTKQAHRTGAVERKVHIDSAILPCDSGATIRDMLTGQRVRMGLPPELASQIMIPGDAIGPMPDRFDAQFVVRPRYLVSADLLALNEVPQ